MLRRDIADRLYSLAYKRIKEEQPERELTRSEIDCIWYTIYGKLSRGESEEDVENGVKQYY